MSGARAGTMTWLRRLASRALARDLTAIVVPDAATARARGLDLAAAGLRLAPTPRHATILVLVGELPEGLRGAAAVAYAQMPRPRTIMAIGTGPFAPLPEPDVAVAAEQDALIRGVGQLRALLADSAFSPDTAAFDVGAVRTETRYTCPMHPEIVRDEPGKCPICGMNLIPQQEIGQQSGRESMAMDHGMALDHRAAPRTALRTESSAVEADYTCPMHPEVTSDSPGSCPICGMDLVPRAAGGATESDGAGQIAHGDTGAYTCPMHPEIVRDEPGSCPICGMDLLPRAAPEAPGASPAEHPAHTAPGDYTCPMHPQIVRDAPGSCPICGMDLVPRGEADDGDAVPLDPHADHAPGAGEAQGGGMDHGAMGHGGPTASVAPQPAEQATGMGDPNIDAPAPDCPDRAEMGGMQHGDAVHGAHDMGRAGHPPDDPSHSSHDTGGTDHSMHTMGGFMSMVAMTRDLPRSRDGLPMEWVEVPFGPLSPGLPGGLALTLTLDGDVVARATRVAGIMRRGLPETWPGPRGTFPDRLACLDPLTPVAYRLLAQSALETAAGLTPDEREARGRIGALERERATSHLGWLVGFAELLGVRWLAERATALQLALARANDPAALVPLREGARRLADGTERLPLLRRRLGTIGRPSAGVAAERRGPLARAAGIASDARSDDPAYRALGFAPIVREGDDALARLLVRLAEVGQSLDLAIAAGGWAVAGSQQRPGADGGEHGRATIETPRGAATLQLTLDGEAVREAHLDAPSGAHAPLVAAVTEGRELADALVGVASLDLSPWELDR